jgi:Flp pilus assembly protein TadG
MPGAHTASPARRPTGRLRHALCGDRGEVTVELVIATPLLLLGLLVIVQFALWSHATHVAQAAASQALAATRTQDGTISAGHVAGRRLLDDLAAGPLRNPRLEVSRTATTAAVRIQGVASAVIPGVHMGVHAEAAGAVERFIPDTAAGAAP